MIRHHVHHRLFLVILGFILGCSPSQQPTEPEAIPEPASIETSVLDKLPITEIPFDPSMYSESWLNVLFREHFGDELTIESYKELRGTDGTRQFMIIATGFEGPGYYQLIENGPEEEVFTLSEVVNTAASVALKHGNTSGIDFFYIQELHYMEEDVSELIVGADITGMYHDDEGMRPYRMVVFDVLERDDNGFEVDKKLTLMFNSEQNIDVEGYTNDPLPVFLTKKYHRNSRPSNEEEERFLMQELLDDMGISSYADEYTDTEFATVRWKEDHYVIDYGWLNSGYFFLADELSGINNHGSATENYPMLYVIDRDVDEWKITDVNVKLDSIVFTFLNLDSVSEEEELQGSFVYDDQERWQFRFDGYTYMMKKDSKDFEVIGLESNQ